MISAEIVLGSQEKIVPTAKRVHDGPRPLGHCSYPSSHETFSAHRRRHQERVGSLLPSPTASLPSRPSPHGTVALSASSPGRLGAPCRAADGRGCRGEASPYDPTHPTAQISVHRVRFPPQVILIAVRWYLRYGLSYRDLEELLAERGIEVDHVTLFRWCGCRKSHPSP